MTNWWHFFLFFSENRIWHFMQIVFTENCLVCSKMTGQWSDRSAIKPKDIVTTRSNELLAQLDTEDLDLILKKRRLWWYGHVEHSNGAVKTAFDIQVDGKHGPKRPKMTERDCRKWKLSAIDPHDRHTWRSGVRSAMCAESQLPGRGPSDLDVN